MQTAEEDKQDKIKASLGMTDNAIEYLESCQKDIIDRIVELSMTGQNTDSVKLKANVTLLNKLVPDRTKMELDVKSTAPYETLLRNLNKEG